MLLLAVASALSARLMPTAVSGMPFLTDSWPLIRGAEVLAMRSPVSLSDDSLFDGYNNYWPGVMLYGSVASLLTGLEVLDLMRLHVPLAAGLSTIAVAALISRLSRCRLTGAVAALFHALALTHAGFTAGVTKESYASTLYIALVLLAILPRGGNSLAAATMAAIGITLSHHLTTFMTLVALVSMMVLCSVSSLRGCRPPVRVEPAIAAVLLACAALYHKLYALRGFLEPPSTTEALNVIAYLAVSIALFTIATPHCMSHDEHPPHSALRSLVVPIIIVIAALILTFRGSIPCVPPPSVRYGTYALPLVAISLLAIIGWRGNVRNLGVAVMPGWLAGLTGVELYAVFSEAYAADVLAYRTFNFMVPCLAGLAASSITRTIKRGGRAARLAAMILLVLPFTTLHAMYEIATFKDPYNYYHAYDRRELDAARFAAVYYGGVVAGDIKASYMFRYFAMSCDLTTAYSYLSGGGQVSGVLYVYKDMLVKGFVLPCHPTPLSDESLGRVYALNAIYDNGMAALFTGAG